MEKLHNDQLIEITHSLFKRLKPQLESMGLGFKISNNTYRHIQINIEDKYFIECASGLYQDIKPHYAFRRKGVRAFKHGYDLDGIINRLLDEIIKDEANAQ